MKTKTALVLTAAGILLTGSTALAVNVSTLNGSPAGSTTPANFVLLPQNSTTGAPTSPESTPGASPTEDRGPASSPSPSAGDDRGDNNSASSGPAVSDDRTAVPSLAPVPAPSRTNE